MDGSQIARKSAHLKRVLDWAVTLLALGASVLVIAKTLDQPSAAKPMAPAPLPKDAVKIQPANLLGSDGAPVVILEYSDFQCPFCKRFAESVFPRLRKEQVDNGRVQVAFKHLPLSIHPFALKAATASNCAAEAGKFWEMHDALFARQQELTDAAFPVIAASIHLDGPRFSECIARREAVTADGEVSALGITGTPAFLIGRRDSSGNVRVIERISGAGRYEQFEAAISKALALGANELTAR